MINAPTFDQICARDLLATLATATLSQSAVVVHSGHNLTREQYDLVRQLVEVSNKVALAFREPEGSR